MLLPCIQGKQDIFGARRYINKCTICGCEGYSPIILKNDFLDQSSIKPYYPGGGPYGENRIIYEYLTKVFKKPLEVDNLGRCEDCARAMDK